MCRQFLNTSLFVPINMLKDKNALIPVKNNKDGSSGSWDRFRVVPGAAIPRTAYLRHFSQFS
jgi:hypothetical protein